MKRCRSDVRLCGALAWRRSRLAPRARSRSRRRPRSRGRAPTFALVSLIGDEFSVVMRRDEIGTRLDPNERRELSVLDARRSTTSPLSAARRRHHAAASPVTPVLRFSIRDPRLFALQDKLLVDSAESHDMRDALASCCARPGRRDLVLVTKRRDDAAFKLVGRDDGRRQDQRPRLLHRYRRCASENVNTGEYSNGFLAPYAFVMVVTLIDVASMRVVQVRCWRSSRR